MGKNDYDEAMRVWEDDVMWAHQEQESVMRALMDQPKGWPASREEMEAQDWELVERMREGTTLTHDQAEMLGWLVQFLNNPEAAAYELRECMKDPQHFDYWRVRILDYKDVLYRKHFSQVASGQITGNILPGPIANGRTVSRPVQQMYNGAVGVYGNAGSWIVVDENVLKDKPKQQAKSAGAAATDSLRDKFKKYNPFK